MEGDIAAFFAIMGSVGVVYAANYKVWKQGMTTEKLNTSSLFSI